MMNPRYAAFIAAHGKRPNWEYMAFINHMVKLFTGEVFGHVSDHDEFTVFIKENAHRWGNEQRD